ncbi:hypothetical protein GQ53DRAFT_775267 [Thozetella sp. PMI_491]|nr:hypothetical protein GQ53DRAFT_775267 [Thozetella sp. PMI_491]
MQFLILSGLATLAFLFTSGFAIVIPHRGSPELDWVDLGNASTLVKRATCGPGVGSCATGLCCSQSGYCYYRRQLRPEQRRAIFLLQRELLLLIKLVPQFGYCYNPPVPPSPYPISTDGSCGPNSKGPYACGGGNCCSSEGWW